MSFKLLVFVLVLYVFTAFITTLARTPTANQQINKQTNYLKTQIREPRTEQKTQKKKRKNFPKMTICYQEKERNSRQYKQKQYCVFSLLGVGPYLNKDAAFDGSKLIINVPTVREDSRLLMQQYQLIQECYELGIPAPYLSRVTLTGKLEAQTSYGNTDGSQSDNININFSGIELDVYVQGNSWVLGYVALDYAPSDKYQDSSRLLMNRAFIAVGNLSQFPLYISIGQAYVPFGRYSSLMVTAPVTQVLGRTRARTLTFGYQQTGNKNNVLHAEVYNFQGSSNSNHLTRNNQNNGWGTDIGYEFNGCRLNGEIGAGYISSLVDSQRAQDTVFLNTENLRHHIPALNVYGTLSIDPVVLLAEYVGTIRSLNVNNISFSNQEGLLQKLQKSLTAFHTEASYRFKMGSKPSSVGVSYDHASQASALGELKDRYSIFYNMNIWRDTNLALEYRHDINYRAGGAPVLDNVVIDCDESDNVLTAQFDLFF